MTRPAGPWETLSVAGADVPLYMIPFDGSGALQAPRTATHLADSLDGPEPVDLVVLSHGWNTDWNDALDLYRRYLRCYSDLVVREGAPRPGARMVVAGVSWPSVALPASSAPAMAGIGDDLPDGAELTALAEAAVKPADRAEFYALAQAPELDEVTGLRLAELLAPLYDATDSDLGRDVEDSATEPVTAAATTLKLWAVLRDRLEAEAGPEVVSGPTGPREVPAADVAAEPAAAGGLPAFLDPRTIVRLATVLVMKDRAGVVGARGLGPVLARLTAAAGPATRIHLVGHSYGCKVLLSALCAAPTARARSALLMQPAMSYLALADSVPDRGHPGGYQPAKARCELPILSTWSDEDFPLHVTFALAVRRRSDLAEQDIGAAARAGQPPSRFAALGGWGPLVEPDVHDDRIRLPAEGRYVFGAEEIRALEARGVIRDHSDVVNDATAWALYNLIAVG